MSAISHTPDKERSPLISPISRSRAARSLKRIRYSVLMTAPRGSGEQLLRGRFEIEDAERDTQKVLVSMVGNLPE